MPHLSAADENEIDGSDQSSEEDLDLPLFDLVTISHATNKFSLSNRLGRGGFGPVYKVNFQPASK